MANRYYPIVDKELASVTTITGLADKSDALIPWAVNCAVDYVKARSAFESSSASVPNYIPPAMLDNVLEAARTEWRTVRDEAGDIGTQVHDALEAYLLAKMDGLDDIEIPTGHMPEQAQELYRSAVLELLKLGDFKVLATEQKVVNEDEWYAGRFDALLEVDGETWLIDFKTGASFYPEWGMQLAAYAEAWERFHLAEREGGNYVDEPTRIDRIKVLRLDKKTLKAYWKDYTDVRAQMWVAFRGLRDAFYVLRAKKKAREQWLEEHGF